MYPLTPVFSIRDMYLRSLKMFEEMGDKKGIAKNLNNIGIVYREQGNYDKAIDHYLRSLKIFEESDDKQRIAISLNNLGTVYYEQGNYDKTIDYFLRSLKIDEEAGDKQGIAGSLNNIGEVYREQGKYELAIEYVNRSLSIAQEIGFKELIKYTYENLSVIYAKQNRFRQAYEYYQLYSEVKDSILNKESSKQINEMEAKYESEKKEKEIELLKKDQQLKGSRLNMFYVLSGGLTLLFIAAMLLLLIYRKNQKLRYIHATIEGQESERYRISKELHDGIGGALASIKLNLMNQKHGNKEGLKKVTADLDKTYQEVRSISHALTPPTLSNDAFVEVIRDFVSETAEYSNINIHLECYPEDTLNKLNKWIQTDLYRILQELVNNIIKHAEATSVTIDLAVYDNQINLMVEDNGKGFDASEKPVGIGLKNIRSRVEQIKGTMDIDSKKGRGTIVNIFIPEKFFKKVKI